MKESCLALAVKGIKDKHSVFESYNTEVSTGVLRSSAPHEAGSKI